MNRSKTLVICASLIIFLFSSSTTNAEMLCTIKEGMVVASSEEIFSRLWKLVQSRDDIALRKLLNTGNTVKTGEVMPIYVDSVGESGFVKVRFPGHINYGWTHVAAIDCPEPLHPLSPDEIQCTLKKGNVVASSEEILDKTFSAALRDDMESMRNYVLNDQLTDSTHETTVYINLKYVRGGNTRIRFPGSLDYYWVWNESLDCPISDWPPTWPYSQ